MTARSRLVRRLQRHGRIGALIGAPPAPLEPQPTASAPAVVVPVPTSAQTTTAVRPDRDPGQRPEPSAEPSGPPGAAQPAASREAEQTDPTWRRLKAIVESHRENAADAGDRESGHVGERPSINVVRKSGEQGAGRSPAARPAVQRAASEEEPPIVGAPEPATEPEAPSAVPEGTASPEQSSSPEGESRRITGMQTGLEQEIELPKPHGPEEEGVVQRLFPNTGMMGADTGFPAPFIPTVGPPVPTPFPPGFGGGPLPFPFPGFPGGGGGAPGSGGGGSGGGGVGSGGTEIGGEATVGGNLQSGGQIEVGGNANAGGSISTGAGLTAGGNVSGTSISAGTSVSAGANVDAAGDITAGSGVDAGAGVSAGGNLSAGGPVTAGAETSPGGNLTAEAALSAGTEISPGANLDAAGPVEAGAGISTGGSLAGESNLTVGGNVIALGGVDVGGNAEVGAALMSVGDVAVGGTASTGAALVSAGDTKIEGAAIVGGLVMASGELSFSSSAAVGGAVIAKGKTSVDGTLSTPVFKGQDVDLGGSFVTNTVKADTLSAGGHVTIGGRADVGTINASSVTIHGPTKVSSGGGSVATKPADNAPDPGVPLNEAWPVQRRVEGELPEVPTAVESGSAVEFIGPHGPRPVQDSPETPGAKAALKPARPVRTEIGDLPADLWQLLGRRSPQPDPERSGQAPAAEAVSRPVPKPLLEPPAPVQRAVVSEPVESEAEDGADGAGPDVEALARKVYAQLRKRLQVEAERARPGRS